MVILEEFAVVSSSGVAMKLITFAYDGARASHAARWLMSRHGGTLDRIKLIKLVFLADRLHLARYGRPIVGGRYCAMAHGPVASELYDAIKEGKLSGVAEPIPPKLELSAMADEDCLAESDVEVLKEINDQYGPWDTFRLRDLTHRFVAWSKNHKGDKSSYPLPYEHFFDDLPAEDREMLDLIRETQEAEEALG